MTRDELYQTFVTSYGGKIQFQPITWENTKVDEHNEKAIKLFRETGFEQRRGVFIHGPAGTGKSHIMKAHFNSLVLWKVEMAINSQTDPRWPYWIKLSRYLDALREEEWKIRRKAMEATWLFLDDLGTSTKTDWAADQVFQLLDERLEGERQTFISSNYNSTELGEMYHARVPSRIAEMCFVTKLDGRDRRMIKLLTEQKG